MINSFNNLNLNFKFKVKINLDATRVPNILFKALQSWVLLLCFYRDTDHISTHCIYDFPVCVRDKWSMETIDHILWIAKGKLEEWILSRNSWFGWRIVAVFNRKKNQRQVDESAVATSLPNPFKRHQWWWPVRLFRSKNKIQKWSRQTEESAPSCSNRLLT